MHVIFESGSGRRARRIVAIGASAAALAGAVLVVGLHMAAMSMTRADAAYWSVSGPPCQEVSQAHIAHIGRPLAQVLVYGRGRFARVSGGTSCNELTDRFGVVRNTVCQFNRPRALGVWSKGGVRFFDFPGGEPATVTASDHQPPRCVMSSKYRGE
jgi:hypothetical protein